LTNKYFYRIFKNSDIIWKNFVDKLSEDIRIERGWDRDEYREWIDTRKLTEDMTYQEMFLDYYYGSLYYVMMFSQKDGIEEASGHVFICREKNLIEVLKVEGTHYNAKEYEVIFQMGPIKNPKITIYLQDVLIGINCEQLEVAIDEVFCEESDVEIDGVFEKKRILIPPPLKFKLDYKFFAYILFFIIFAKFFERPYKLTRTTRIESLLNAYIYIDYYVSNCQKELFEYFDFEYKE
jgi:hypothetical protein